MAYLLSMMLLTAVGFIYWMPRYKLWTRDAILKLIFSTLLLMVSVYCVVRPGFSFAHYSFFLLWPIATLAGSVLLAPNSGHISKGGILIGIIVASLLLASGAGFWETKLNPLERFAFPLRSWKLPGLLEVAGIEDIFASGNLLSIDNAPGQRVFVWGWMAQYYLYANLTPAVRDIINHKQIDEGSLTSYFQERLISDLMHDPPDYVVDAVANRSFRYSNSVTEGLSSIPKIHKFIREEYTLMSDSTNGVDCSKIYARNSIAKIHRARYARVGNLQVSSQLDSSYSPSQLIDGVLFDTCQRAWLLPNRTQGTLTFNLVSPQEVRTLELLNTRNWPQFNRASRRVRIEASQRGQRIFEQEVIMRRYPYWTEVPFPSGLGEIDSITVNIIDFLGIGGGLTQVRVRTSD